MVFLEKMAELSKEMIENLIDEARKVRENAYCNYSKFHVGCALLGEDGKIYTGCNVENLSFGSTTCAERVIKLLY